MAQVRECAFSQLAQAPNFAQLIAGYARESASEHLPVPQPRFDLYTNLDASGALRTLCAFDGDTIVGFLLMIVSVLPHYGAQVAVIESFYVDPAHRKQGTAMQLVRQAEQVAQANGALALFANAATGGRLARMLDGLKTYHESHRVFFRTLA